MVAELFTKQVLSNVQQLRFWHQTLVQTLCVCHLQDNQLLLLWLGLPSFSAGSSISWANQTR